MAKGACGIQSNCNDEEETGGKARRRVTASLFWTRGYDHLLSRHGVRFQLTLLDGHHLEFQETILRLPAVRRRFVRRSHQTRKRTALAISSGVPQRFMGTMPLVPPTITTFLP